ncbi:MAG: hypothetical protein CVV25_09940 [Ignavibacteriae bacterium HGW-Ignavibacteriae-4]|jgi:ribosomal protein S6E (S10)|nr:MAG: hypothetical protein CVV25_09940 [Ignavibacteriae bacterium HGW-Ignavibacteriae-4]
MKIYFFFIIFLVSCSVVKTNKNIIGEYQIIRTYNKELKGGVELHLIPLYYDSTLGAGVEVLIDGKYVVYPNKNGEIRINLKKKSCISLNIFSLNSLVFSNENLCFDSNKVIHAKVMLEW